MTTVRQLMRRLKPRNDDQGNMSVVLLAAMLLLALGTTAAAAAYTAVVRSRATTNETRITEQIASGQAEALRTLNNGSTLPATQAAGVTSCQQVDNWTYCNRYWAVPVPGESTNPTKYNLVIHTWVDRAGDHTEPADGVTATLVPLQAITYQDRAGANPQTDPSGWVSYPATPLGLFAGSALHSFSSTTVTGPDFQVVSYNSKRSSDELDNGVVSSDGTVSYGPDTQASATVLYGGGGAAGDYEQRCTGEACGENAIEVLADVHAKPTPASESWITDAATSTCTSIVAGDWVASAHGATLPSVATCIQGNLIIDVPTKRPAATAVTLYVFGNVYVEQSLNAPGNGMAKPNTLQVYTTGRTITLNSTSTAEQGIGISALIYAPFATCANNPTGNGKITYYGSLVCDTISLAGPWAGQFDEAAAASLTDPAPDSHKVWTVGVQQTVKPTDYLTPENWDTNACVVPTPANARGWWKLDERAGLLARDSSGAGRDAAWTSATGRVDGVCGGAAPFQPGGSVAYPTVVTNPTAGMTVQFWAAQTPTGVAFSGGGVSVELLAAPLNHLKVTAGGTSVLVPFTVQHFDSWHRYSVTVTGAGGVTVYVDGKAKGNATAAAINPAGSAITIGSGASGVIDEVMYFDRVLSASDVEADWSMWNDQTVFSVTNPGDPFTAPGAPTDAGSSPTKLSMAWTAASGTLPPDGAGAANYQIERASTQNGTYTAIGSVALSSTVYTQTSPPAGSYWYRACTVYNGDSRCSPATNIVTVPAPVAPSVTAGATTTTTAVFSWTAQQYATSYDYQWRANGGSWSGVTSTTSTSTTITAPAGAVVDIQVRTINAAGTSGWSTITTAYLLLAAPSVSASNITTTTALFSWTTVTNTLRYESQYRLNGGAWSSTITHGTGTSITHGPTTQGTRIEVQVRAVNQAGAAGAWSAVATANLLIDGPKANGWETMSSYPALYGRLVYSGGPMCPGGTVIQDKIRDQVTSWGTTWNGYSAYVSGTAGANYGPWMGSWIASYDVGARQLHTIRCFNPSSGNASAEWGEHGPVEIWHPIPAPTGAWAGIIAYRTAGWGASCVAGTTPSYVWRVEAATFNTGTQGWTFGTEWANQGQAWGAGTVYMSARCEASGRYSSTVSASGGFG